MGQLSLNSDGSFTYLPDENFFGTDSFTYYIDDGFGVTQEATVTLVVDPVNDVSVVIWSNNYFRTKIATM